MSAKYLVANLSPVSRDDKEVVLEILCEGNESRDEIVTRFRRQKYPPAPEIVRPIAPVVARLLDAPFPKYDSATVDAASKFAGEFEIKTRQLNLTGAEALDGPFAPGDLLLLSGGAAGIPVVTAFDKSTQMLGAFPLVCVNPVVAERFKVPASRKNIVINFAGCDLVTQFARAFFLAKILALQLGVFAPSRMTTDFWFKAGNAAANAKFARAACKLGYSSHDPFGPNHMAATPGALSAGQPPAAAVAMLNKIGIERRDYRQNLVLFKGTQKGKK